MRIFQSFVILLLTICVNLSYAGEGLEDMKCQLKAYENTTWYGEFKFYTGTTFIAVMYIDEVKNCKVTGRFHWPDFFNTKTIFSGTYEDGKLAAQETRIYQGLINNLENGSYSIELTNNEMLSGVAFTQGNEVASIALFNKDHLAPEEVDNYKARVAEMEEKYGVLTVGEKSTISIEALKQGLTDREIDLQTDMSIDGRGIFSGIELPIVMKISTSGSMYMKMEFMGTAFQMGKNDSISWSYDPTSDQVEVTSVEKSSGGMNPFNDSFGTDWLDEIDIDQITDVNIDGVDAYRISFKIGDDINAVYFGMEDFQPIRAKNGLEVREFLKYKNFGDMDLFTEFKEVGPHGVINTMYLDHVEFIDKIDEEIFNIPEDLKAKVMKEDAPELPEVAKTAFDNEEYERAVELYTQAIKQSAYDHESYYMRGRARYTLGDYYKALGDMERAIELNDQYADYHNYLGLIKYALSDYSNSKGDFLRAIQLDSTGHVGYLNYAFAAFQLEEYESAITYLDKGITYNPDNGQLILNRGVLYFQLDEFQKSLKDYRKTLELGYGDRGETLNRIGVAFYGLEQYDSAALYFRQGVDLSPDNLQRQKNLGDTYYQLGTYEKAIITYRKAQELTDEPDATLLNDLAMSYYHSEDYQTALAVLNELIETNNENASYYDNRAYTYTAVMDYQNAIKDFSRSIDLYSTDKEIYYQRGLLYQLQNNRFDACRDFQTAADMEHEEAARELKEYCTVAGNDDGN